MPSEKQYWVIDIDAHAKHYVPTSNEEMMSVPIDAGPFDSREEAESVSDGVEQTVVATIQMVQP